MKLIEDRSGKRINARPAYGSQYGADGQRDGADGQTAGRAARAIEDRRLLVRYHHDADPAAREALVERFLPLARQLARRYERPDVPFDDLFQVACLGLVKAIDRFEPGRGSKFSSYAAPTILGELKRHFRDKGWAVRVPRRLQELNLSLNKVVAELSQEIGRSPTIAEIATKARLPEEEVLEGLDTSNAYAVVSLDAPAGGEDAPAVSEHIGAEDESLEALEYRAALGPMIASLPERERRILYLRFFGGMTQSQIAARLGISQMHVSRLLNRTLAVLREGLLEDEETG